MVLAERDDGSASDPASNGDGGSVSQSGPICRSDSSLDIFDDNGAIDPTRYRALAAAFATNSAIGFRFGADATAYHATPETFATIYEPSHTSFPHGPNQSGPFSTWEIGGPYETDPGGYNSSAGIAMYVSDDANAAAVDAVDFLEVSSNVVLEKPQVMFGAPLASMLDLSDEPTRKRQDQEHRQGR